MKAWVGSLAGAFTLTIFLQRILQKRIDQLGHALNGALVLSIYILFVGIMCGSSGAYFTAFALSFVAPVLAEAINPAYVDLLHALTSPTLGSLVFALLHSAINSVDRLYLSEWPRPPA